MMSKQLACAKIGKNGCYFLSLVYIAEKIRQSSIDVLTLYETGLQENWFDEDCYMLNPAAMMSYLLNCKVDVRHDVAGYKPKKNEYEITRFELKEIGVTFAHFVVTNNGKLEYDPYGESKTRTKGKPKSTRIITILE